MSGDSAQKEEISWYKNGFEILETRMNGERGSLFHAARADAHKELLALGLPAPKDEDWKYTDIREVVNGDYQFASKTVVSQVDEAVLSGKSISDIEAIRINTVDGFVSTPVEAIQAELPEGVTVTTLRELFAKKNETLLPVYQSYFGKVAETQGDAISALNTAYTQDGLVLHVEKNVQASKPIYIQHVASGLEEKTALFPRLLCVVEDGAECTLVEHFTSLTDSAKGFTSSLTELSAGKNSKVTHYQIGEEAHDHIRFSRVSSHHERDAQVRTHSFSFGGKLVRNEVHPTLNGENAFTGMYGLSVLKESQHVDNHTVLDHAVPHCESDERYKGIYDDDSKGVFCGTIIVRPDAQKTNAIQNNQAVLLSDRASVNTKPQLKIWADDVKCTHGATVGQLDSDQLFYLRSRGVGEKDARNMLVRAFAGEVTQEIGLESLRQYIEEAVVSKLRL